MPTCWIDDFCKLRRLSKTFWTSGMYPSRFLNNREAATQGFKVQDLFSGKWTVLKGHWNADLVLFDWVGEK